MALFLRFRVMAMFDSWPHPELVGVFGHLYAVSLCQEMKLIGEMERGNITLFAKVRS